MNRFIFTTVYDEVLHKIETLSGYDLDRVLARTGTLKVNTKFKDSKNGYLKISLVNSISMKKEIEAIDLEQLSLEQKNELSRQLIKKHILFKAQDIIICRILLSHYINNQIDGDATITLDTIHKAYIKANKVYSQLIC